MKLSDEILSKLNCCEAGFACAHDNNLIGVEWSEATRVLRELGDTQNYLWMKNATSEPTFILASKPLSVGRYKFIAPIEPYERIFDNFDALMAAKESVGSEFDAALFSISKVSETETGDEVWSAASTAAEEGCYAVTNLTAGRTSKFANASAAQAECERLRREFVLGLVMLKEVTNAEGVSVWVNLDYDIYS